MQGAEIEDEGSVLKYMTKSEIEEQRSSLLIMTQRPVCYIIAPILNFPRLKLPSRPKPEGKDVTHVNAIVGDGRDDT